jgi:hypothetical protein
MIRIENTDSLLARRSTSTAESAIAHDFGYDISDFRVVVDD